MARKQSRYLEVLINSKENAMSDNTIQTNQIVEQQAEPAPEEKAPVESVARTRLGQHAFSLENTVAPMFWLKDVYSEEGADPNDSSSNGFGLTYLYKDNAPYMPRGIRGSGPYARLHLDFMRGNADLLGSQRTQASLTGGYQLLIKDFVYVRAGAGLGLGSLTSNFGNGYVADPAFSSVFQANGGAGVQWNLPIEGLSVYGGVNYTFEQGKSDGIVYQTHAVGINGGVRVSF